MSFIHALLNEDSAGGGLTPLDYGGNLRLFFLADAGITLSGSDVTIWTDQDTGVAATVPSGARSPVLDVGIQNGFDGVNFQQPIGELFLNRKINAAASVVDDHWGTDIGNPKTLAFAGKLNRLSDTNFGVSNTIISKGYRVSGGWHLFINSSGTLTFQQRRANGSSWTMSVPGFYSVGDLVLGTLTYDGTNTINSGFFRLYDGSSFVTAGTITVGSDSNIGADTLDNLVLGNIRDPSDGNANAPFEGPLFSVWMTRPGISFLDESYLSRWIV